MIGKAHKKWQFEGQENQIGVSINDPDFTRKAHQLSGHGVPRSLTGSGGRGTASIKSTPGTESMFKQYVGGLHRGGKGVVASQDISREQFGKAHKNWAATADEFVHPPWVKSEPKEVGGNVKGVISASNANPKSQFMKAYKKESQV